MARSKPAPGYRDGSTFVAWSSAACWHDPGPAGAGVQIEDAQSGRIITRHTRYLGERGLLEASFASAELAVLTAKKIGAVPLEVRTDQLTVQKHALGVWVPRSDRLAAELERLQVAIAQVGRKYVKWTYVRQRGNLAALQLARLALAERIEWTSAVCPPPPLARCLHCGQRLPEDKR